MNSKMKQDLHKILYIEDDSASRMLVKKILDCPPFQYFEAASGLEGLMKCADIHPDFILMDLVLPDISGAELTTKIKSIPELNDIIIVAITAEKSSEAREISLIAGCDGYIPKPIDTGTLPEQILNFLKGKREQVREERRDFISRRYAETLVDHLTAKVKELQLSHKLLSERTNLLKHYSLKLELLLSIINNLQLCRTQEELEEKLVEEIRTHLRFDRCVFFEMIPEQNLLKPTAAVGIEKKELKKLMLRFDFPYLQKLFKTKHIHLFGEKTPVRKQPFVDIQRSLQTNRFIFGLLGAPRQKATAPFTDKKIDDLLSKVLSEMNVNHEADIEVIRDHLKEYLSSEIFTIGGYLLVDNPSADKMIQSYDIGILEMLLRTSSLIYQNLQLSEQLKELFVRAERDAVTDYLTGLFNYRYFRQQLAREFDRARRHKTKFVALMIDIDHFKSYNDTFGHQAGDIILKNFADILRKNTRSSDLVARYGGEEFVIICPELDKNMGMMLAEKLRELAAETCVAGAKISDRKITISVGIAAYPDDAVSPDELIRCADNALYSAKEKGRNRVKAYAD